jgi:hypothetical protein
LALLGLSRSLNLLLQQPGFRICRPELQAPAHSLERTIVVRFRAIEKGLGAVKSPSAVALDVISNAARLLVAWIQLKCLACQTNSVSVAVVV